MKELAGSHSRILRARHFHMVDSSKRLLFFGSFFHCLRFRNLSSAVEVLIVFVPPSL